MIEKYSLSTSSLTLSLEISDVSGIPEPKSRETRLKLVSSISFVLRAKILRRSSKYKPCGSSFASWFLLLYLDFWSRDNRSLVSRHLGFRQNGNCLFLGKTVSA